VLVAAAEAEAVVEGVEEVAAPSAAPVVTTTGNGLGRAEPWRRLPAATSLTITVDAGPGGTPFQIVNVPFVSVTVCNPGPAAPRRPAEPLTT